MRRLAFAAAATGGAVLTLAAACDGGPGSPFDIDISPAPEATATPTAAPTAAPTPTPEPTPAPESAGMDGFRAFAALIDDAVAVGDGSFFSGRGVEEEQICTGEEQLGPCAGESADTMLRGIPGAAAQSDAFALFTPDDYAAMLQDWFASGRPEDTDVYGSGEIVLYALAHRPAQGGADEAYLAIVSGIVTSGPDALRQARVLNFQFLDGGWRLISELLATVEFTAADYLSGDCGDCYDAWERWEGAP